MASLAKAGGTVRKAEVSMCNGEETPVRQDPDATTTSERDSLGQYLDYQRETILLKTDGLTKALRWMMLHLIEETARHAGHADLLREAIDGVVGE